MEHEPYEIIDEPLFWEEEEHFHFFEKKWLTSLPF